MSWAEEALVWAGSSLAAAVRLSGDASTRMYFRVPKGKTTEILMVFQDDETSRWQAGQFSKVRTWLERLAIPAPRIIGVADNGLWFRLEDLGDLLMEQWLPGRSDHEIEAAYRRLAAYSRAMVNTSDTDLFAPPIRLDAAFLEKELLHFHRHFWEDRQDDEAYAYYRKICGAAAAGELRPAHRDYHSRNVLVRGQDLFLIDFQDARWAHPLYDIGSLLYEAYVEVRPAVRRTVLSLFDRADELPAVVLQRSLKAMGTFAFQWKVRKNPFYLRFLPRCYGYAREQAEVLDWRHDFDGMEKRMRELMAEGERA